VNRDFWRAHPDLFEEIGMTSGTDAHGAQAARHRVAAADLSAINRSAEDPMDFIIGYPTLRQADWLFNFPAKRWTLTS
jgi:hypothetical protein